MVCYIIEPGWQQQVGWAGVPRDYNGGPRRCVQPSRAEKLMTRFQLILPVDSQNVTKNRTDHRMHVEGPQICQINGWNNSSRCARVPRD